ncbi:MAG: type IV pilus modification protein PilV [Thermodesulfobacteriota bacterium]|nr:type IV pilus modification protein PilV [Thermodesulfobacteriota bacterium]
MNKILKGSKGFTLLEVLIALTILSIGLLGMAQMQIIAIRSNSYAFRFSEASAIVQDKLEELKSLDYLNATDLDAASSPHTETEGLFTKTWTVVDNQPTNNMKTVNIEVSWDNSRHKVTLSTTIARR